MYHNYRDQLTISATVAILLAVVASYLGLKVRLVNLLLRAVYSTMANFAAVVAATLATINDLTGIIKTSKNFLSVHGPILSLLGAHGPVGKSVSDAVLLSAVALEVHVGKSTKERTLHGNEEELDTIVHKTLLNFTKARLSIECLDVFLNTILGVINITFGSGLLDLGPSGLGGDNGNIITIDLASILTSLSQVT